MRAVRRWSQLIVGYVLFGIACALIIRGGVGNDPWTVFSQGLSLRTGISIGMLTTLIGLAVLLLWIPLRQRPGIGTVGNILVVGPFIDVGLWFLPEAQSFWSGLLMCGGGIALLAIATGLYIGARMGPGPRDGLMTGLNQRFGWPIWVSRTSVEITVLAIGWLLGGTVGLGTVLFATLVGPLCNLTLPVFDLGPVKKRGATDTSPTRVVTTE